MKNSDKPIVVQQSFNVSTDQLWRTITELNQMKQWFFKELEAFEPKVGFETRFVVENEDRIFPHLWKITEVEQGKKITYNWKYEGYKGDSFVTFEVFNKGTQSQLILTHRVTEDFPQDIPEFKRESCLDGWNWFVRESLTAYLNDD